MTTLNLDRLVRSAISGSAGEPYCSFIIEATGRHDGTRAFPTRRVDRQVLAGGSRQRLHRRGVHREAPVGVRGMISYDLFVIASGLIQFALIFLILNWLKDRYL